jgi:hypothetical protein
MYDRLVLFRKHHRIIGHNVPERGVVSHLSAVQSSQSRLGGGPPSITKAERRQGTSQLSFWTFWTVIDTDKLIQICMDKRKQWNTRNGSRNTSLPSRQGHTLLERFRSGHRLGCESTWYGTHPAFDKSGQAMAKNVRGLVKLRIPPSNHWYASVTIPSPLAQNNPIFPLLSLSH